MIGRIIIVVLIIAVSVSLLIWLPYMMYEKRHYNESYEIGYKDGLNDSSGGLTFNPKYKGSLGTGIGLAGLSRKGGKITGYKDGYIAGYDRDKALRVLTGKSLEKRLNEQSLCVALSYAIQRNDPLSYVQGILGEPSKEEKDYYGSHNFAYNTVRYYNLTDKDRVKVTFVDDIVDTCSVQRKGGHFPMGSPWHDRWYFKENREQMIQEAERAINEIEASALEM